MGEKPTMQYCLGLTLDGCLQVDSTMSWEMRRGLEGMRRLVAEHRIAGVYGTLIDLIDVMHQLYSAVEVSFSLDVVQQFATIYL